MPLMLNKVVVVWLWFVLLQFREVIGKRVDDCTSRLKILVATHAPKNSRDW